VLDTGVACENWRQFRRSPDFKSSNGTCLSGFDFIADNRHPADRNGHGTHVAGTIAEQTNNALDLTGLAYGSRIIPIRVLNARGEGDAATIAQGIRFAVRRNADVINLSLEFGSFVEANEIPDVISALRFAHRRGTVIVGASGNESSNVVSYPARARQVIAVGATTEHGCQSEFSTEGRRLDISAPGGGPDTPDPANPLCKPSRTPGRNIFQLTFEGSPRRFGIPDNFEGTSMAAPHVSATAALVIASGVLGSNPSPEAVRVRLKQTARPLGAQRRYGAGLVDAAAATRPSGPQ
jgi:serine protease